MSAVRSACAREPAPLIVTADDLGLHPGIAPAVVAAARLGRCTSASLLVNRPGWEEAAEAARRAGVELGLHLNLTEGEPVSPPGEVASLLGRDGRFLSWTRLALRLGLRAVASAQLVAEVRAQVACMLEGGFPPAFLNGHQHVHLLPPVYGALARVVGDLRLRIGVRRPRAVKAPAGWGRVRPAVVAACARMCGASGRGARLPAPDLLLYLRGSVEPGRDLAGLVEWALGHSSPRAVLELACHPGPALETGALGAPDRPAELSALTGDGLAGVLSRTRLIRFSDLLA